MLLVVKVIRALRLSTVTEDRSWCCCTFKRNDVYLPIDIKPRNKTQTR
jgi:hypothetical protein